ncbi:hypothetical protein Tco_1202491 [Tanacetum coccineum]
MAHLVTSITLNSARSYVMQSAFLTQRTVSSIPIVFSWSDSIRPEGFLSSVMLWLVIILAVLGVSVMIVVVAEKSGTIVGHKVANSLNLLTYALRSFPLQSDVKIRLPSSGPQFGDSTSLSKDF